MYPSTTNKLGEPIADINIASEAGLFRTLASRVQAAESIDTPKGAGLFTAFAPTENAFAELPANIVKGLLKDIPQLEKVPTYHTGSGKSTTVDAVELKPVKTVEAAGVTIDD